MMKIVALALLVLLALFAPLVRYEIWWRRWRGLPDHNPYKGGDSR